MNRISVRGAAVATAMASTSMLAAAGVSAATRDTAAADTFASDRRVVQVASLADWAAASAVSDSPTVVRSKPRASRSLQRSTLAPRELGRLLAAQKGWRGTQWSCLDKLWSRESGWRVRAANAGSGAYGVPQALPASKMATFGSDWRTNARTQIRWGLSYIDRSYGTPCAAWRHSRTHGYY